MFDLDSWLTGFALGLAGKPLPFSTAKETLLYNLSNFSGRYLSFADYRPLTPVLEYATFDVGEAPLEFSCDYICASTGYTSSENHDIRVRLVPQQAITAGSNVRIKVLFPECTIDSTYHDSSIVDKPTYNTVAKQVEFINDIKTDGSFAQVTRVYIENEELKFIGNNGKVINIADDTMTLLRNNAGEVIGVDLYGTLVLDITQIIVSHVWSNTGILGLKPVDAVVRAAFNSYNNIQIWLD